MDITWKINVDDFIVLNEFIDLLNSFQKATIQSPSTIERGKNLTHILAKITFLQRRCFSNVKHHNCIWD